jgi:hypothetical protein
VAAASPRVPARARPGCWRRGAGGPRRAEQFGGYLAVAPAGGNEPQLFKLTRREPERRGGLRGAFTAAGAGELDAGPPGELSDLFE